MPQQHFGIGGPSLDRSEAPLVEALLGALLQLMLLLLVVVLARWGPHEVVRRDLVAHLLVALAVVARQLVAHQLRQAAATPLVFATPERLVRPVALLRWPLLRAVAPCVLVELLARSEPLRVAHPAKCVKQPLLRLVKKAQCLLLAPVVLVLPLPRVVRQRHRLRPPLVRVLAPALVWPLLAPLWPVLQVVLAMLERLGRRRHHEVVHMPALLRLALALFPAPRALLLARLVAHRLRPNARSPPVWVVAQQLLRHRVPALPQNLVAGLVALLALVALVFPPPLLLGAVRQRWRRERKVDHPLLGVLVVLLLHRLLPLRVVTKPELALELVLHPVVGRPLFMRLALREPLREFARPRL